MTRDPSPFVPAELLWEVVDIARRAGDAIMSVSVDMTPIVEMKQDKSPLTRADLASHRVICDRLTAMQEHFPILSEESTAIPYEEHRTWETFWLVDPLDGTKDWLSRNGEFTVNIALIRRGFPILGVVYVPATAICYYAAHGFGAHKINSGGDTLIGVAKTLNRVPKVVVSRWHSEATEKMRVDLAQLGLNADHCHFVSMGSSLKFCLLAEGGADLYLRNGPTMEWDTAAAHCILEIAGGIVSDLKGNPLRYNKPMLLNPSFVASATDLISVINQGTPDFVHAK